MQIKLFKQFIVLLGVLITLSVNCSRNNDDKKSDSQGNIYHETTEYSIQKEYIENTIDVPGTVSFIEKATISTSVTNGTLTKLRKEVGDSVYANEIIAELDKDRLKLELIQAENNLVSAKAQYKLTAAKYENAKQAIKKKIIELEKEKASLLSLKAEYENSNILLRNKKELWKIGGITESEYNNFMTQFVATKAKYFSALKEQEKNSVGYRNEDLKEAGFENIKDRETWVVSVIEYNTKIEHGELMVAQSNLKNATSQVELAKLHLKEATIRSPISGVIADRGYDSGEMVKPDTPIYTVVKVNEVYVTSSVSEEKLVLIKKGQTGEFSVDAIPDKKFTGRVHVISPVIDPKSRMAEIKVKVGNSSQTLKPGMFVRLKIIIDSKKDTIAIPKEAFIQDESGKEKTSKSTNTKSGFCYVIKEGKTFKRTIAVGSDYNGKYPVIDGLIPGDIVAVSNVESLQDGGLIFQENKAQAAETVDHENKDNKK